MEQTTDSGARIEAESDPIRTFLMAGGKLSPDQSGERDDRVYNAAMSCIDLSMRPYERRLLNRAVHDADRLETLVKERPFETTGDAAGSLFSQSEFREFVGLIEREVQRPNSDGPVPALFRSGANLVAASYLWEQEQHAGAIRAICQDLRASLRLLEDLLNWVETGRRGDRIETLQEAQKRLDAVRTQTEDHYAAIRTEQQHLAAAIGELKSQMASAASGPDPLLEELRGSLGEIQTRLVQLGESQPQQGEIEAMRAGLESKLAEIAESNERLSAGQREIVTLLDEEVEFEAPRDEGGLGAVIDQLRLLMLIGLVGIGVVAILVIVSITVN